MISYKDNPTIILTSYAKFPRWGYQGYTPISISYTVPQVPSDLYRMQSAIPDYETMVKPFKEGNITWEEYEVRYLTPNRIVNVTDEVRQMIKYQDRLALLCWCTDYNICHRSIVYDIIQAKLYEEVRVWIE